MKDNFWPKLTIRALEVAKNNGILQGIDEGLAYGKHEGFQKGKREGRNQGQREMAFIALGMGIILIIIFITIWKS